MPEHPNLDLLEELWRSGLRAKAIMEYIDENDLPKVSYIALAKYGQRKWSDEEDKAISESINNVDRLVEDIKGYELGSVERISISKTGYSISVKPSSVNDLEEIKDLPRTTAKYGDKIPKLKRGSHKNITHVFIPDTQIEPGRPNDFLLWISYYLRDRFSGKEITLIHAGDHWNMGSLSSYDKGTGKMEGRRYIKDIEAGNRGFELLESEISKEKKWNKHFLDGNHEDRIYRASNSSPQLQGLITLDHCLLPSSWTRHGFLQPVTIDGITYSHYFYNPNTGKPYGGTVDARLKNIGHSFVMGHQQGLMFGNRYVKDVQQIGIVAGSAYLHEEDYKGPQGEGYWRGIVVLNNVCDGSADPEFISLDQLCKIYEGKSLKEHNPQII